MTSPLLQLPAHVLAEIARRLEPRDQCAVRATCSPLRAVVESMLEHQATVVVRGLPAEAQDTFRRFEDAPVVLQATAARRLLHACRAKDALAIDVSSAVLAPEAELRAVVRTPSLGEKLAMSGRCAFLGALLALPLAAPALGPGSTLAMFGATAGAGAVFGAKLGFALLDDAPGRTDHASRLRGTARMRRARALRRELEAHGLEVQALPEPTEGRYRRGRAVLEALERNWFGA